MNLCVIPARGGSKRIPGKNIRDFAGRPIIAYSIEAARASGLFDQVIVSTDDEKIAEVARQHGAQTPFTRPSELSDDHTGTADVIKHAISWYREQGKQYDYVCCIYATAPFVQVDYLQQAYRQLLDSGRSFVFSVTGYDFPVQRALYLDNQHGIDAVWPENIFRRSQDLPEMYHDAGQFYWGRSQAFVDGEVLYSAASAGVVLPRYLVQDIDTPEDWRRAELMYRAWKLDDSESS